MAIRKTSVLTPLELQIMQILWERGPSTVAEVVPHVKGDLAYTTVQTMLNVLLRKKRVARIAEGRAHRYRALTTKQRASGNALTELIARVFGGSAEALLLTLVDTKQVSPEELTRLGLKLAAIEASKKE